MKLIVKTLYGAEQLLKKELEELGATNVTTQRRAVTCQADKATMYKINLWSRLALRVLIPVAEFPAHSDKEIYNNIYRYDWHKILSPDKTIMFDHVSFSSAFNNSQFLAFRAKDAVVDKMRDNVGARPSVDTENPDVMLNIHATDDLITVSLDASGASLHRRGYRSYTSANATNEVLAAALVDLSGWTPDTPLIDPMCGSGTICIEAAMKARNIAANLYRKDVYGFMNWLDFDQTLWNNIVDEAKNAIKKTRLTIIGSDIDGDALDIAKQTTLELGLSPDVRIVRKSLREQSRTTQSGTIITCPPTRNEDGRRPLEDIYKELTYRLSQNYPDHDAWLFSTNLKALRAIEFQSEKKIQIFNGSQEGSFNLYPF